MELNKQNSFLREHIKCPICYEEFSDVYKPLIIPCGHTICSQCVINIKKISAEDIDDSEYFSDDLDEEFDISLDTEEEEEEHEEGEDSHQSQSEMEEEDNSQEDSEDSDEEDEDEDENQNEEDENSIEVENFSHPDLNLIKASIRNEENLVNLGEANNLGNVPHFNILKKPKIKFKCSICRKNLFDDTSLNLEHEFTPKKNYSYKRYKKSFVNTNECSSYFLDHASFVNLDDEIGGKINCPHPNVC